MRERSILFARDMVLALRAGRKTQTRRLVSPQPDRSWQVDGQPIRLAAGKRELSFPFGEAGDRLWVREKWGYLRQFLDRATPPGGEIVYGADGTPAGALFAAWKPSLYMPRIACRMMLEVTGGRAERLQQISPTDARAEGCPQTLWNDPTAWFAEYWEHFNAARGAGWDANPWVWVVNFKLVAAEPATF
jgi:hypothetical protein